ncbi:CBO2463/CBO2479 domain-containing protein [Garciella nitratireducens]|uniref:CBO2463/CBO2479 domain-containing protein n=1 Tax=Garciella nitratireducens TaxID=218205 RepID=UPI000DEB6AFD|nr:CBO2463/CBO2479 domain-containing protein [Garciella nitratireducens]RBP46846.1 hypothetical protein DFR81_101253 [Garciella nitratireducens]
MKLKYGDKIIYMEGIITKVEEGAVEIDFKGRLGHIKVPMRMIISDYPLKVGQEVGFNMSFLELLSPKINEKYRSNLDRKIDKEVEK